MNENRDPFPEITLMLEGVQALHTPLADRQEALLIVATGMKVMKPEGKHLAALVDFMEDAA